MNKVEDNVMMKVNVSKAYDRMEWGFIKNMVVKLNFNNQLMKIIKNNSITNCCFTVGLNGISYVFFSPSTRVLRHGDPLCPCLFVLAVDYMIRGNKQLMNQHHR